MGQGMKSPQIQMCIARLFKIPTSDVSACLYMYSTPVWLLDTLDSHAKATGQFEMPFGGRLMLAQETVY